MTSKRFPAGWQLNFLLEHCTIEAELPPPASIDDLIEEPNGQEFNFTIGYPTREDALAALHLRVELESSITKHLGDVFEHGGDSDFKAHIGRRVAYLQAVRDILDRS